MSKKFIRRDATSGLHTEESAVTTQTADSIVATDGTGKIPSALMPTGIGADTKAFVTSEDLSAGDLVNLWLDTTEKARKADASTAGKEAVGFVLAATTSPAEATVYFEGIITGLTGLTLASRQYLSASTAGAMTETPVSATGNVHQYVGKALSATEVSFEATDVTVLV